MRGPACRSCQRWLPVCSIVAWPQELGMCPVMHVTAEPHRQCEFPVGHVPADPL